jgi:hypothetical protein
MTISVIGVIAIACILAAALRSTACRAAWGAWTEPVLTKPVLIVEADDWGYGPLEQSARLRDIAGLLVRHRDSTGNPAVMTLGVVLAGPDTPRIAAANASLYHRASVTDAPFADVRSAMLDGVRQRCFALQLHGMEHFMPEIAFKVASRESEVRQWFTGAPYPPTEALPAPLQSRWIDASQLPSAPLDAAVIKAAAREEVDAFARAFGQAPAVVVPPTFIWNPNVERAWREAGIKVLITPGVRYEGRDAAGKPRRADGPIFNAQRSPGGLTCLVRNDYFEPAFGHTAERGLAALAAKTRLGRPTLLETHRANFLGESAGVQRSLGELDRLLAGALARFPSVRFMCSAELAHHYTHRTDLVERNLIARLRCLIARLMASS